MRGDSVLHNRLKKQNTKLRSALVFFLFVFELAYLFSTIMWKMFVRMYLFYLKDTIVD